MTDTDRFQCIGAESMLALLAEMNKHANNLGRLLYFGENKTFAVDHVQCDANMPFIAVFDLAALVVATIEDIHDMREELVVDTTLEKVSTVMSA